MEIFEENESRKLGKAIRSGNIAEIRSFASQKFPALFNCAHCGSSKLHLARVGNQNLIHCNTCDNRYSVRRKVIQYVEKTFKCKINRNKIFVPPSQKIKVTKGQKKVGHRKIKALRVQIPKEKNDIFSQVSQSNTMGLNGSGTVKQGKNSISLTYLMFDGRFYKIGMAQDPQSRRKDLETSPGVTIRLVETSSIIKEKTLHKIFKHTRVKSNPRLQEWFYLDEEDLNLCLSLMRGTASPIKAANLAGLTKNQGKTRKKNKKSQQGDNTRFSVNQSTDLNDNILQWFSL